MAYDNIDIDVFLVKNRGTSEQTATVLYCGGTHIPVDTVGWEIDYINVVAPSLRDIIIGVNETIRNMGLCLQVTHCVKIDKSPRVLAGLQPIGFSTVGNSNRLINDSYRLYTMTQDDVLMATILGYGEELIRVLP